ncbi:MAG: C13 family peptidase [Zoogloeaceae bacterium]|jgi:hypothetical protein|nr:C13 family peptidase [Zoogloeaceae bacterium]
MNPPALRYSLTPQIARAALLFSGQRLNATARYQKHPLFWLLILVPSVALGILIGLSRSLPWAVVSAVVYGLFTHLCHSWMQRQLLRPLVADLCATHSECIIGADGVRYRSAYLDALYPWSRIGEPTYQPAGWIALPVAPHAIIPISESAFANADDRAAFLAAIGAGRNGVIALAAPPAHPPAHPGADAKTRAARGWRVGFALLAVIVILLGTLIYIHDEPRDDSAQEGHAKITPVKNKNDKNINSEDEIETEEIDNEESDETAPVTYWLDIDENLLYSQPRLLAEHLAAIKAGQSGKKEIFFLGLGGSEQGVFMRETMTVETLFKERFATTNHSIILVNNAATVERLPLANTESLRQALKRIGQQMNGAEDLLFLFMTSHGSRAPSFSISLWPFNFSDITPETLKTLLDESGIQNRVVVVSACYSGAFIPKLADKHTLVITASAADRNSFGCNDTNDLTDFGRAYFDEALRQTRSFSEAFTRAKTTIARREREAGLTPSLPQIAGGQALKFEFR